MASASSSDWRPRVYQELKRHRPAMVVVTLDDGEQKVYKASGGERGRWTRLLEALPVEWSRIELQDKDEAILWGLDAPREGGTSAKMLAGGGSPVDQLAALSKIFLQGQDMALARQGEMLAKIQASYETLTKTLVDRLSSLEGIVSGMMQTVYDMTLVAAEAESRNVTGGEQSQGQAMLMRLLKMKGVNLDEFANGGRKANGVRRASAATPPAPTPPE